MKMAQPDSKKIFFENLSGAGKAIAVLTSGGDAQGKKHRGTPPQAGYVPRPLRTRSTGCGMLRFCVCLCLFCFWRMSK